MKYILLLSFLFIINDVYCSQNILNDLEFDSSIFHPGLKIHRIISSTKLEKRLSTLEKTSAKIEYVIDFLDGASTKEIKIFYNDILKKAIKTDKSDRKILYLVGFRLIDQEDPEQLMNFIWHLKDFSDGFAKDSWDNFIVACIMFSITENEHRIKLGFSDKKEEKIYPDPYHAMEKAIMLSDSAELHYLIAQVFRQLAYTNVKAHKIVVLELEKAEAILKIQNKIGFKSFLKKEVKFLRDFLELYRFYDSKPPFYIEEAIYTKMVELNAKDSVALNNLADLYLRYNTRLKKAKELLDEALKIDGDNPAIIDTLGYYYLKKGDVKNAEKSLLRAELLNDDLPIIHVHLAELYYYTGDTKKNIEQYEKLIKLSPGNAEYFNDLGYQLSETGGDLFRAIALCQKAVMLSKGKPAYLDSLAWAYFKNKEYKRAKDYIEKAISGEKNEKYIFYHAGEIYFKLKEYKIAMKNLNEALKLFPGWKEVTKKLGVLIMLEQKDISEDQAVKLWK